MVARSTLPRVRRPLGDHRHSLECLAKPAEVARHFGVNTDTVRDYANAGKIWHIRPAGGPRRYCWFDLLGEQS